MAQKSGYINETRDLATTLAKVFNDIKAKAAEGVALGFIVPESASVVTEADFEGGNQDVTVDQFLAFFNAVSEINGFVSQNGRDSAMYRMKR